jgi:hypothetical protein
VRVVAGVLALVAVACLVLAIADMATGREGGPRGWVLRAAAVACFAGAIALNVRAH